MATPFHDVYSRALFRLRDTNLARLNDADKEYMLHQYMLSAIGDFQPKCLKDLSARTESGFSDVLSDEEQEILALGISYYWLSAQVLNNELLKNKLSTKDYTYFSPANLLRESVGLRDQIRKEYKNRITQYTYDHGNLALD